MSQPLIVVFMRDQRKENSCSACVHFVEDLDHLSRVQFLRRATSVSAFDLWFRPRDLVQLLGLHGASLCTISRKWLNTIIAMYKDLDRVAFSIKFFLAH